MLLLLTLYIFTIVEKRPIEHILLKMFPADLKSVFESVAACATVMSVMFLKM